MIRLTAVISLEDDRRQALTHESAARSLTLGRDESADFQLPVSTISRQHARIYETDGVYVIEDLGSTHGTVVNGRRIDTAEKVILHNGDIIELTRAKITCAIETDKLVAPAPHEATQAIAERAIQGILGRLADGEGDGPYFRVLVGPGEGGRLNLDPPLTEWAVGRADDCELMLDDPNVSRRHALVKKDWHGFTIEDLGSRNGVVVRNVRIEKPRRLKDRDEVVVGPVKLLFIDPNADLMASLKDVPGFGFDEIEEMEAEESHFEAPGGASGESQNEPEEGTPSEEPGEPDGDDMGMMPPMGEDDEEPDSELAVEAPEGVAEAEDDVLPNIDEIDPDLLDKEGRTRTEWIVFAGVGVLIVVSILVLVILLT